MKFLRITIRTNGDNIIIRCFYDNPFADHNTKITDPSYIETAYFNVHENDKFNYISYLIGVHSQIQEISKINMIIFKNDELISYDDAGITNIEIIEK